MDHSNLFHEALTKVHDIAMNGIRNNQSWKAVLDTVEEALRDAQRLDREVERNTHEPARAGSESAPDTTTLILSMLALVKSSAVRSIAMKSILTIDHPPPSPSASLPSRPELHSSPTMARNEPVMTIMEDIVAMAWAAKADERLSDGALYGKLAAEIERLRTIEGAAKRVCRFDWSDNDDDAVAAINDLWDALNGRRTVTCVFEAYGGPRCTDRCMEPKDCNGLPALSPHESQRP